jgi:hypothetical protein
MKKIILILLILQLNCITYAGIKLGTAIDGKSKTAESLIQGTALIGLFGDIYAATLITPQPYGIAYGVLSALFYLLTDGGISDRIGRDQAIEEGD